MKGSASVISPVSTSRIRMPSWAHRDSPVAHFGVVHGLRGALALGDVREEDCDDPALRRAQAESVDVEPPATQRLRLVDEASGRAGEGDATELLDPMRFEHRQQLAHAFAGHIAQSALLLEARIGLQESVVDRMAAGIEQHLDHAEAFIDRVEEACGTAPRWRAIRGSGAPAPQRAGAAPLRFARRVFGTPCLFGELVLTNRGDEQCLVHVAQLALERTVRPVACVLPIGACSCVSGGIRRPGTVSAARRAARNVRSAWNVAGPGMPLVRPR